MRILRGSLVFSVVLLVACAGYFKPLWNWVHTDSVSIAVEPLPEGRVLSVSSGYRWADPIGLHVTELDEYGAVINHWEFDGDLAPDEAAVVEGNVFLANGFDSPLTRFDLQSGLSEDIPLALPVGTTDARVSTIQSMAGQLLVLGSVLIAGTEDEYIRSFWMLDSEGGLILMEEHESISYFSPLQELNDNDFVFHGTAFRSSGLGDSIFKFNGETVEKMDITADQRYVGVDIEGIYVFENSAEGNYVQHLGWDGQTIGRWMSDYAPKKVFRSEEDDIIALSGGSLRRIAPDGSVIWSQVIEFSSIEPEGQIYTHFDITEYSTSMVANDGDILVGMDKYKGRLHGFVNSKLWIRNQMTQVFERFDSDGNKVKTYQGESYTRVMQPSVYCFSIVCGSAGDRVESAGACETFDMRISDQNRLVVRHRYCAGVLQNFGHMVSIYDY